MQSNSRKVELLDLSFRVAPPRCCHPRIPNRILARSRFHLQQGVIIALQEGEIVLIYFDLL